MTDSNNIKKLEEDFGELLLRKSWAELSAEERRDLGDYVSDGMEYDRIRTVLLAAVSSEDSAVGLGMPAMARAGLMELFDRERAGGGSPPVRRMVSMRRWWLTGAAAAVLLLVASVWWAMQRPGMIDEPVKPAELAQRSPDQAPETTPPAITLPEEESPARQEAVTRAPEQTPPAKEDSHELKPADTPPDELLIAAETSTSAEVHPDETAAATETTHKEVAITYKDADQVTIMQEDFMPVKQIRGTRELPAKPIPTHKGKIPSMSRPVIEDRQLITFLFECR